jgi:hypothetical protein
VCLNTADGTRRRLYRLIPMTSVEFSKEQVTVRTAGIIAHPPLANALPDYDLNLDRLRLNDFSSE